MSGYDPTRTFRMAGAEARTQCRFCFVRGYPLGDPAAADVSRDGPRAAFAEGLEALEVRLRLPPFQDRPRLCRGSSRDVLPLASGAAPVGSSPITVRRRRIRRSMSRR